MKKSTIWILATALALGASGCKKLIEIEETNMVAGAVALRTVSNIESAVVGAYGALRVEMEILANATFSDEVRTAGEFYNAATTHEWLFASQDVGLRDNFTAISPQYTMINRANVVLANVSTADSTLAGDNTKRARLRGEALFLRAWGHFELFRYYGSSYNPDALAMPYMEASTSVKFPRINQGPYFQRLLADIIEAKGLLPKTGDNNRATFASASALHARIALYMRDWANAEAYATAAITAANANSRSLSTIALFPGLWTDANESEVLLMLRRTTQVGGRIGSLFRGTSANLNNIGTIVWQPTDKLTNAYDKVNDVRYDAYIKDEPLLIAAGRTSRIVNKYSGGGIATTTENINNAKAIRLAEVYLIRAEARAEQGRFTGNNSAEADINLLRTNRITGYTNVTFTSQAQAITAIMDERFKELAFEGHRFFDLKRRGLPVQRLAVDAPNAAAQTLPANDYRFLLPIPQPEMLANPLMEQNPNY